MRKIKFRAWDIREKKFSFPSIVGNIIYENHVNKNTDVNEHFILSQFTGLLDKNETEIYEGDIMKLKDGTLGIVEFYRDAWYLLIRKAPMTRATIFAGEEVIGNQFENPELILKWHA